MSTPCCLLFSLVPTYCKYIRTLSLSLSFPISRFLSLLFPTYAFVNLYFSLSLFVLHTYTRIGSEHPSSIPAYTDLFPYLYVQRHPESMGGIDIKAPKQELSFMTLHSSFYAFFSSNPLNKLHDCSALYCN